MSNSYPLSMSSFCLSPSSSLTAPTAIDLPPARNQPSASTLMLPDTTMTSTHDNATNAYMQALQLSEAEASIAACKLTIHAQQQQLDMHNEERELHHSQLSMLRVSHTLQRHAMAWRPQPTAPV